MTKQIPIIDLHCDLTSYLVEAPDANLNNIHDIGCALPHLEKGNVKMQVMAVYTATEEDSTEFALAQLAIFQQLIADGPFHPVLTPEDAHAAMEKPGIGITIAIENASGLCEEDEPLDMTFARLEHFEEEAGRIFYISFTHHLENRFGGGNKSTAGLKDDGKELLDYLDGRGIAVDLSHASDALAYGILEYTANNDLDVPIIASHSNFRTIWDHVRNLPFDLAEEIIQRQGLIGMNFLREYVNRTDPSALMEHIMHGIDQGAASNLAFGADYFYTHGLNEPDRMPMFFAEHANARSYHPLLQQLRERAIDEAQLHAISYSNVLQFIDRVWS